MNAYIAISFSKKNILVEQLSVIKETLQRFSIEPFVFIETYQFNQSQANEMMQQAFKDISDCDLLIAETSFKEIGIGIEVGYAKAKNKPIIYLRHANAAHSTTVFGTSDFQIVYNTNADLSVQLSEMIQQHFALHKK